MRKYLLIYFSHKDKINQLTDEEAGKLFKAALTYGETGEVPSFGDDRILNFAWADMKEEIDIANESYEKKVRGSSKGGKSKALRETLGLSEEDIKAIKQVIKCDEVYPIIEEKYLELKGDGIELLGRDFANYVCGDTSKVDMIKGKL